MRLKLPEERSVGTGGAGANLVGVLKRLLPMELPDLIN